MTTPAEAAAAYADGVHKHGESCWLFRELRDAFLAGTKYADERSRRVEEAVRFFLSDMPYKAPEQRAGALAFHLERFQAALGETKEPPK